jgi:hypothetical protein
MKEATRFKADVCMGRGGRTGLEGAGRYNGLSLNMRDKDLYQRMLGIEAPWSAMERGMKKERERIAP